MGIYRVFARSVRVTTRSKRRFIVFLLIFAILSSFVAFYIDSLDSLFTDQYLSQKGIYMDQQSEFSVTNAQGKQMEQLVKQVAHNNSISLEGYARYNYADLDPYIRVFSLDITKPWYNSFAKPSLIISGRYPTDPLEVLVPAGSYQYRNSTGVLISSDIVIGQTLDFRNSTGGEVQLHVVGTFDISKIQMIPKTTSLWLFAATSTYTKLLSLYGKTVDDGFTYSMSFIVTGNVLSTTTYNTVKTLNNEVKPLLNDNGVGLWQPQPFQLPAKKAIDDARNILVFLLYVVAGGIFLSTIFSYLISKFRRKEIAILKAMGYHNGSVRVSLIAEILTTAIAGFVIGIGIADGSLFYLSGFARSSLLRTQALGVSFLINVVITIPGMLFASWRVLSVSPAEAFRDK